MLKSLLSEPMQMCLACSSCSLDVVMVCSLLHLCAKLHLKAFVLKEWVWAQWHSVDTERAVGDIFILQIILRSDYFSIKMIDLTWITPTQQWMSEQKNEPVLSQQGKNVICVSNVIIFMGAGCVCVCVCVLSGNSVWQPHRTHPSVCPYLPGKWPSPSGRAGHLHVNVRPPRVVR